MAWCEINFLENRASLPRVADLRERGHKIITEPLELNGKRFAKYRLIEVEGAKNPPKRV